MLQKDGNTQKAFGLNCQISEAGIIIQYKMEPILHVSSPGSDFGLWCKLSLLHISRQSWERRSKFPPAALQAARLVSPAALHTHQSRVTFTALSTLYNAAAAQTEPHLTIHLLRVLLIHVKQ